MGQEGKRCSGRHSVRWPKDRRQTPKTASLLLYLSVMACPGCGADVAVTAKFCFECGRPQEIACPSCGSSLPVNAKFCGESGTSVNAAAAPAAAPADTPAGPLAE